MTLEAVPRRRNKTRVVQGMLFVWVASLLAIPAILLLTSQDARSDRLFGAWIMLAVQVVVIGLYIVAGLYAAP